MTEETPNMQATQDDTTATGPENTENNSQSSNEQSNQSTDHMIPKGRFDEVNTKFKEASAKVAEYEKAQADADKAKSEADKQAAIEQGKWQEAYEKLQKEADADKAKVTEAEAATQAAVLAAIKLKAATKHNLPDELAARLIGDDEEAIMADAETLSKLSPPPSTPTGTDASSGVNGSNQSTLTDVQIKEMAAVYGVTEAGLRKSLGAN